MAEIVTRHIEEHPVEGKPLGRHVEHDPRSREYPAEKATTVVDVLHVCHGALPFDQGRTGSCTGNASTGGFNCGPNFKGRGLFYEKDAQWIYHQEVTTIEGQVPFRDIGGTGVAVAKAARNAHWITSFTHTFSMNDALLALAVRPGIIGINWYDSFDQLNPDTGILELPPGAQVRGGHELLVVQVIIERQLIGLWQSWGLQYGIAPPPGAVLPGVAAPTAGYFFMPFAVFERLLSEQGDVTFLVR